MSETAIKNILKLNADEILDYVLKNPEFENDVMNNLKIKERTKWFKVSADLKSYKQNSKGSAAVKINLLENISANKSILSLKTESIKANPAQPRKVFSEDKIAELSESIKEHGLLQPIVVTQSANGLYTLVAGERRLRAHKLANIAEINAIVIEADELTSRKLAIIENLHRDNLSPMEEGLSYLALQLEGGYSLRALESIVMKNKNYIAARLNLTKFDSFCIEFILNHELTNVSKLTKILDLKETLHKDLLEKLSKGELTDEEINNHKIDTVTKLPDEVIKETVSSGVKDVDHDKFDEDSQLKKENSNAQHIEMDSNLESNKSNQEFSENKEETILKKGDSYSIAKNDNEEKISISINTKTITSVEIDALKDFLETI